MATVDLSIFSNPSNHSFQTYDTKATAEQPWVGTKFSVYDSDVEVRSSDGFIFQLHRVVLGVTTGAFPGSELDTGAEVVQLTEPANVLGIIFAFLYPKEHPDLHGEIFQVLSAVAEAAAKYEVFSAVHVCNERLVKFLPEYAPEILAHAVKHDYPRLIRATLPHFARAPFIPVLARLPPSYVVPWARYHEAWRSVFKETVLYIKELPRTAPISSSCHSSMTHRPHHSICPTCVAGLYELIGRIQEIETLPALHEALQSPARYPYTALTCCRHSQRQGSRTICPFVEDVIKLCQDKIKKIPPFATFLGIKV
ncbi:hypothetical protein M413DRAFT_424093 [Hebeloma cylindrosporum]|uniref:BTB domain-containing protein n=1 Tax=Hebeloma cylindrosporum TaxID=76867 RepID=A0A0C2XG98_HEBCY|nr:hypothetical protein M413DRAFT_424093 [Hebeloma cylindrosporum h7]